MWMLVYVEAGLGSLGAFGVFMAVLLGLIMIYMMASWGIAWVSMPLAAVTLLQDVMPGWGWLALFVGGILLNLIARHYACGWHPFSIATATCIPLVVLSLLHCIIDKEPWYMYLLIVPGIGIAGTLLFYPFMWALMTLTAVPLVFTDKTYAKAAIFCFLGLICGVVMLHSLVALFISMMGGDSLPLLDTTMWQGLFKGLGVDRVDQFTASYHSVLRELERIPLGWRFVLSTAGCIGCTIGEWKNSEV